MVILARESERFTQSELAAKLGVGQATVSKIEAGLLEVTRDLLGKLSSVLNYPADFFQQQDRVFGVGASEFFHRKRQSLGTNPRRLEKARGDDSFFP